MASLMNELLGSVLSKEGTAALASKTGADENQVQSVVKAALPALLQSMVNNAGDEKGAASLAGALENHSKTKGSVAEQIEAADTEDGSKILKHLLGGDKSSVQSQLAKSSGLSSSQVGTILASLAPVLLSSVGKQTTSKKSDSGGLGALLISLVTGKDSAESSSKASSKSTKSSAGSSALGSILDVVTQDGDGDGKSDVLSSLGSLLTGK